MNCVSQSGQRRAGSFTPSPITGYNVVSTFRGKGKICDVSDDITDVFPKPSQFPSTVIDDDMRF